MEQKEIAAFSVEKKLSFADAIISRLQKLQTNSLEEDMSQEKQQKDIAKLVQAFTRLMVEFDLNIKD